ncbi:sensor histidine kinase [Paenibacillus chartarius]|uniref:histidine kinase n=1 Tax=Paenibacillus chartarius TaxID=747481 RepID=A0ABV6DTA7_9BACL
MLARLRRAPLLMALVCLVVVITLNAVYYVHFRTSLIDNQKVQMNVLFNSVRTAIETTAAGEKLVEDMVGENLRTASIAALYKLDPDIDKVTNEELVELSETLNIAGITLFKQTEDDIVGLKSSDPKEINVSSKGWDTYYKAFQQMLDLKPVDVGIGQTFPYYWSGPKDTSTTNQTSVDKWGYYYDGTTNYIIDPFVHDTHMAQYYEEAGVDRTIQKLVDYNEEMSLEISVLNPDKLLGIDTEIGTADYWFSERLVLFGDYRTQDPDELYYARKAIDTMQPVYYTTVSNGRHVFKSFNPLDIDYLKFSRDRPPLLIEISTDYTKLQASLDRQLNQSILFIAVSTVIAILIIGLYLAMIRKLRERVALSVQEAYVGNIDSLFHRVREQRHDYNNHLAAIHAMATMGKFAELKEYTKALVGDVKWTNDRVDIGIPAVGGLIHAKIAQAESLRIAFEQHFSNMEHLEFGAVKATDLVKILSNLIDNAFDSTKKLKDPGDRMVKVTGIVLANQVQFKVMNTGEHIAPELHRKLFERGYSTKERNKHAGLGLHIVKSLVASYKGSIHIENIDGGVEFTVMIPVGLRDRGAAVG